MTVSLARIRYRRLRAVWAAESRGCRDVLLLSLVVLIALPTKGWLGWVDLGDWLRRRPAMPVETVTSAKQLGWWRPSLSTAINDWYKLITERTWNECLSAVHLRIREVDQLIPKSLYPTTSGNTYWQVEAESSILHCQ